MDYMEIPEQQLLDKKKKSDKAKNDQEKLEELTEPGEVDEALSRWALLPDVCLRQVFWWLRDSDRARSALVCCHWHRIIRSPSLWRQRTFNFSGRISWVHRSELDMATAYVKAYGSYLEDLELRFTHPLNSLVSRRFQLTMRTFLAAMRKSGGRLRSLTIHYMDLDRTAWCRSVRNALVRSLTFYLRREASRLSFLSLRRARFNLPQGLQVLEAVAAAQHHVHLGRHPGLASLNLEDFFSQSLAVYNTPDFARVMQRFRGLCNLTLNYSCISDELLHTLASCCTGLNGTGSLRSLTVRCHVHEPHVQVIWGDAWALLAQKCPALQVHLSVEQILDVERLNRILLREIPLHTLSLTSCYLSEVTWTVKPALTHLVPRYRNCLKKLSLDLNNRHETIDEELLEVVTVCANLTYLKVWAFLNISFLDRLLQKRLERKCALNTIKVRLYTNKYDTREEDEMLGELFARYKQLIDSELNCFAITYPMI